MLGLGQGEGETREGDTVLGTGSRKSLYALEAGLETDEIIGDVPGKRQDLSQLLLALARK